MRTLLHLSDLHFGRIDPAVLGAIKAAATEVRPDLVVVSGDLTQRARPGEFAAARAFLDSLPFPRLVVPGNHDVPMHNVLARFLWPSREYRLYIDEDPEPVYRDKELLVIGVNTARSLTIKSGRINSRQIERVRRMFCGLPEHLTKIVACHHPFDLPESCSSERVVGGASEAVSALAECGADLVLSGHYHVSHAACSVERYAGAGHSMLLLAAGTAASTRLRREANAFNVVRVQPVRIEVIPHGWSRQEGFKPLPRHLYERSSQGWVPRGTEPPCPPACAVQDRTKDASTPADIPR